MDYNQYRFYHNKPGVRVTFSNGSEELPITYILYNHVTAKKFKKLLYQNINNKLIGNTDFEISKSDYQLLKRDIDNLLDKLNIDKKLSLSELHVLVENNTPTEDYVRLNKLIHSMEQQNTSFTYEEPRITADFNFENSKTMPLTNEDLMFFRIDRCYGDLCMGYNTLGKHWTEIAGRDEKERINEVQIQKHLSSEGYMIFRPSFEEPFHLTDNFVNWYRKNTSGELSLDMALGYIVVGKLVMPIEWNTVYCENRAKWTTFLSRFKTITKVEKTFVKNNVVDILNESRMINGID
jgi:hypothetical protein